MSLQKQKYVDDDIISSQQTLWNDQSHISFVHWMRAVHKFQNTIRKIRIVLIVYLHDLFQRH